MWWCLPFSVNQNRSVNVIVLSFERCTLMLLVVCTWGNVSSADIRRWDTGEPIAGTASIGLGEGIDLSGWDLPYTDLELQWLENADFRGANLSHARLTESNLVGADFTSAILPNTDMRFVYVRGASFAHAKLVIGISMANSIQPIL